MKKQIPANHQAIMPYIIVDDAVAFLGFIETVFDAKLLVRFNRDNEDAIMHAEASINGSTIMFANSTGEWGSGSCDMFVYVDDADEIYKKAIAAGATSLQEPTDREYGRASGIKDQFGNTWWITSVQ